MSDVKAQCLAVLAHIVNYYKANDDDDIQAIIETMSGRTTLDELGMDDLDLIDFIYRIEDQLGIQLDDSHLDLKTNLDTVFSVVRHAVEKKSPA